MSQSTNSRLLAILKAIRAGRRNPQYGICRNVKLQLVAYDIREWTDKQLRHSKRLLQLMQRWPQHSGEEEFPIPGGQQQYVIDLREATVWQGDSLKHRVALLDFLIDELETKP